MIIKEEDILIGHCGLTHCCHSNPVTKKDCMSCEYVELSARDIENLIAKGLNNMKECFHISDTVIHLRRKELLRLITDSDRLTTTPGNNGPRFWMFGTEIKEANLDKKVLIHISHVYSPFITCEI